MLQENKHIGNVNLIRSITRTRSSMAIDKRNNVNVKNTQPRLVLAYVLPCSDSFCLVTVVARADFKYSPKKTMNPSKNGLISGKFADLESR